jgi:hypothetical protein
MVLRARVLSGRIARPPPVAGFRPPSARAPRAANSELIASALVEVDEVRARGDLAPIGLTPPRAGLARSGSLPDGGLRGLGGLLRHSRHSLSFDCGRARRGREPQRERSTPRDPRAGTPSTFDVTPADPSTGPPRCSYEEPRCAASRRRAFRTDRSAAFTFASDRARNLTARRLSRDRDLLTDRGVTALAHRLRRVHAHAQPHHPPIPTGCLGGPSDSACRGNERGRPEMNRGIHVVVKRAPVEEVRDGHGDYVRDRVGRGGDDDDRPEARKVVIDQRVGDPAETLGRVVIAIRRRVEADRVQIPADRFAQQQSQTLTAASPWLADGIGKRGGRTRSGSTRRPRRAARAACRAAPRRSHPRRAAPVCKRDARRRPGRRQRARRYRRGSPSQTSRTSAPARGGRAQHAATPPRTAP